MLTDWLGSFLTCPQWAICSEDLGTCYRILEFFFCATLSTSVFHSTNVITLATMDWSSIWISFFPIFCLLFVVPSGSIIRFLSRTTNIFLFCFFLNALAYSIDYKLGRALFYYKCYTGVSKEHCRIWIKSMCGARWREDKR